MTTASRCGLVVAEQYADSRTSCTPRICWLNASLVEDSRSTQFFRIGLVVTRRPGRIGGKLIRLSDSWGLTM